MKKPDALYYICHKDNLVSILKNGILSRNLISKKSIKHEDIHDSAVLARRNFTIQQSNQSLADYVNLYFQPRNAMLYRLVCNIGAKNLAILAVNPSVMNFNSHSLFTDRNAAASTVNFYTEIADLKHIDSKIFKYQYWTQSDDTKQRMMAEVLVPDKILPSNILSVYLSKNDENIENLGKEVVVQPDKFFHPIYQNRLTKTLSLSKGDMFFSSMQTFTISVNTVGIMGKGLASRTKYQFPDAYVHYQDDCKYKRLKIGKPTLFKRGIIIEEELADEFLDESKLNGTRWFLFLPTKRHWKESSNLKDIKMSMQWLVDNYRQQGIKSIAMPALGCGLGGLHWREVGPMMCYYLNKMSIASCIYLPDNIENGSPLLEYDFLLNN